MFSNRQMKVIFNGAGWEVPCWCHGTQEINLLKNSGNLIKDESPSIEYLPCSTAIKEIPCHPQLLAGGMTLTSVQWYAYYVAVLQLACLYSWPSLCTAVIPWLQSLCSKHLFKSMLFVKMDNNVIYVKLFSCDVFIISSPLLHAIWQRRSLYTGNIPQPT